MYRLSEAGPTPDYGHALYYARPSNNYWACLAGITSKHVMYQNMANNWKYSREKIVSQLSKQGLLLRLLRLIWKFVEIIWFIWFIWVAVIPKKISFSKQLLFDGIHFLFWPGNISLWQLFIILYYIGSSKITIQLTSVHL